MIPCLTPVSIPSIFADMKIRPLPPLLSLLLLLGLSIGAARALPAVAVQELSVPILEFINGKSPAVVTANNSKLTLVPSGSQEKGRQSLKVELDARHTFSGIAITPPKQWDWSKLGDLSLVMKLSNLGKYSVQVYAVIVDESGASSVRSVCIPVGNKPVAYTYVLKGQELKQETGMRDGPPAWTAESAKFIWMWGQKELDLSRIAKISLYTETILRDRTFVIDSIRLIPNPPTDPGYLTAICDRFGQNSRLEFPGKIHTEEELTAKAAAERAALAKSAPLADRSRFGGWKNGPRLKATGYFRTEKVGPKWALVDPEGYLYFATGIANARMANTPTITGVDFKVPTERAIDPEDVTPEDSKGLMTTSAVARESRFIASELRHKMFAWLPEYNDPLAKHYSYERSVHTGSVKHGESFSFYEANLERRYGENSPGSYLTTWRDVTVARMLDWGFTSLGNWADPSFYHVDKIPYFANGWIIGDFKTVSSGNDYWAPLPDPFDPEFVRRARLTTAAIAAQVKGSPWCLGVFVDNEKSWGRTGSFESQYGLVLSGLKLDAAVSPTKAAFTRLLQVKYRNIAALNTAWGSSFESWDTLAKGVSIGARNDTVKADFSMLLTAFAGEYFRVVQIALHEVMPNHLYMGVRMAVWGMTPEIVAAAKKYTDVISYNLYKEGVRDDEWPFLKEIDMPSIIGEFHMGATSDTGLFHPGLIMAADQADRARLYTDYMNSVIDNPYFVGAHWFQYIDSPLTGRAYDGENYNVGFVTITDQPYPEMVAAAQAMNRNLYQRRYGDVKGRGK